MAAASAVCLSARRERRGVAGALAVGAAAFDGRSPEQNPFSKGNGRLKVGERRGQLQSVLF